MSPATFHVLLALAEGEQHGYAIAQDVETRTNGEVRLAPGTLYRTLHRLVEEGLIVEAKRRPAKLFDDERRRYYRITRIGTAAARAETARLNDLVRLAKSRGLAPAPAES